jgi:hypothetical protein
MRRSKRRRVIDAASAQAHFTRMQGEGSEGTAMTTA